MFENSTASISALCNLCEDIRNSAHRKPSAVFFNSSSGTTIAEAVNIGWEGRTILGTQAKPLYSQMALSLKPFGIRHVHIKFFA
jgi:hypothetical protein